MNDSNPYEYEFFRELMPKLYDDFDFDKVRSWGGGFSNNEFSFNLQPNSLFAATEIYNDSSCKIEHFTSCRNLFNILNQESIRMYAFSNMNDPNEYYGALPEEYINEIKYNRNDIFCFCGTDTSKLTNAQVFNLWRLYGEEGFGAKLTFEVKEKQTSINDYFLKNVVYEKLNISNFIEAKEEIERNNNIEIKYHDTLIASCCLHKNEKYSMEFEKRLVFFNNLEAEDYVSNADPKSPYFEEFSYANRTMTKYRNIKLNDPDEEVLIKLIGIELGYKHSIYKEPYTAIGGIYAEKSKRIGDFNFSISELN